MAKTEKVPPQYEPAKPWVEPHPFDFSIFPDVEEGVEIPFEKDEVVRFRPRYIEPIKRRIEQAMYRAIQYEHRPRVLGPRSPYTQGLMFEVEGETLDADGKPVHYFPTAYRIALHGGYVYASTDLEPVHWITCTCTAFKEHTVPCKHAALVYLYLLEAYEKGMQR